MTQSRTATTKGRSAANVPPWPCAPFNNALRSRTARAIVATNTQVTPKKAEIMTTTTTKPPPLGAWQAGENDILAAAYLDMLSRELLATTYNKSAIRREGITAMAFTRDDNAARSGGAWEMKCCNVSAVMRAARLPWINGYKPLGHGQARPLAAALVRGMLAAGWSDDDIRALEKAAKL